MIRYLTLIAVCLCSPFLYAEVFIRVCDPCDLTPLEVNQVMTGTRCALMVSCDANDLWSGGLFLSGQNRDLGVLYGRNPDPNFRDWTGSHKESAGPMAKVYAWEDSYIRGFDFYTSEYDCNDGVWFLVDYQALREGDCTIQYYDHSRSWTQADPNISILIENIPFVDFYVDNMVDMKDFMVLASYWLNEECTEPDWCGRTDMDKDGIVDVNDLTRFAPYWLWGIAQDANTPAEPNYSSEEPINPPLPPEPNEPAEPNIIYSILDGNGLDEIVLETGQSVRLYISRETRGVDSSMFYLETFLYDPNAGWIYNREYDPNDPNTALMPEILALPRDEFFDYYGPGYLQPEGITVSAVSFSQPIEDGSVASFVYTATRPGYNVLWLYDYDYTIPTRLDPIIIRQVEPGQDDSQFSDADEMAQFLENIWLTSPELQQTTSWSEWQLFVNEVKATLPN